jgi:hypothetical protein
MNRRHTDPRTTADIITLDAWHREPHAPQLPEPKETRGGDDGSDPSPARSPGPHLEADLFADRYPEPLRRVMSIYALWAMMVAALALIEYLFSLLA